MGNHAEYYKDALRFLGCTQLEQIPGKYTVRIGRVYKIQPYYSSFRKPLIIKTWGKMPSFACP